MNLPIHKYGKTERRKFGKINEVIDIPNLVEIQKESYDSFIGEGISEILRCLCVSKCASSTKSRTRSSIPSSLWGTSP